MPYWRVLPPPPSPSAMRSDHAYDSGKSRYSRLAARVRAVLSGWGRMAVEAGEALDDIPEEARLALLAVGDDVDTGVRLPADDVGHRLSH